MAKICDNCQASCGDDDVFCENCGYDFVAGTLPDPANGDIDPPSGGSSSGSAPIGGAVAAAATRAPSVLDTGPIPVVDAGPRVVLEVAVDRDYFDRVVTEGELEYPDDVPPPRTVELYGRELHVGRTSDRRGIHPAIDIVALTGDPAVSSRHAIIRVADDHTCTLTDVGSTNGTFIADFSQDAVIQGVPHELPIGVPMYLGAWSRLILVDVGED
jgi:hypothetical protein